MRPVHDLTDERWKTLDPIFGTFSEQRKRREKPPIRPERRPVELVHPGRTFRSDTPRSRPVIGISAKGSLYVMTMIMNAFAREPSTRGASDLREAVIDSIYEIGPGSW
jgi:hypothetical protein